MTTCPDKCQACEIRDADPTYKWYLTYSKSLNLCKRCARMLANRLPAIAKEVCMGKVRKVKRKADESIPVFENAEYKFR